MTRSRSNSISSNVSSATATSNSRLQSAMARPQTPPSVKSFKDRVKCALLGGEKGNGLPDYGFGYGYAAGKGTKTQKLRLYGKSKVQKQENPVARLKLLLVGLFRLLLMNKCD
jgi:hydroxymethylglutaryl-CoA reductase (NADPH)